MKATKAGINIPDGIRNVEFHNIEEKFAEIKRNIIKESNEEDKYIEFLKTVLYFEEARGCKNLREYDLDEIGITVDFENLAVQPVNNIWLLVDLIA